jgi:hypothetical protein
MRIVVTLLLATMLLAGRPASAGQRTPGAEAGLALGAAFGNLVYLPAKTIVAFLGFPVGAFAAVFTGGSTRAAYAIWVPTASGTWALTPDHLDGTRPIEFFGTDYADRPSTMPNDNGTVYDALYRSK